jgi:hypothetical protein
MGDDGHAIAQSMFTVLGDDKQRTADRMEAAKWLADRGFGKAVQALDIAVNRYPGLDITDVSADDLKAPITFPPVQEAVDVVSVFKVELLAALTVVPST